MQIAQYLNQEMKSITIREGANQVKLNIIVPVSPQEPLSVIERSVESLSRLEHGDIAKVHTTYVIDVHRPDDPRVAYLQSKSHLCTIVRTHGRGRRAGAINDALDKIGKTDYLAFFDVDSRPDSNFLVECVRKLEENGAVIASAPRYITNPDASLTARIVATEYAILTDIYQLLERYDGFKQFNGLVGVLDAQVFDNRGLDESTACEDVDITQQVYLGGGIAVLAERTCVGEQAPGTLKDYYNQRTRWINGAYEGLNRYLSAFVRAKIPMSRKITWLSATALPFVIFLFSPLTLLYGIKLWKSCNGIKDFTIRLSGLILHAWILQVCSLNVLLRRLFNMQIEWKEMGRSDI